MAVGGNLGDTFSDHILVDVGEQVAMAVWVDLKASSITITLKNRMGSLDSRNTLVKWE